MEDSENIKIKITYGLFFARILKKCMDQPILQERYYIEGFVVDLYIP